MYSLPQERAQAFTEIISDMNYGGGVMGDKYLHEALNRELIEATRQRRADNLVATFKGLIGAIDFLKTVTPASTPAPVFNASIDNALSCAANFAQDITDNRDVVVLAFSTPPPAPPAPAAQPAPAAPRKR